MLPGVSVTFEVVAVVNALALRLVTASPAYTVAAIVMLCEPIKCQVVPSGESYAENELPTRSSRTHRGGTTFSVPAVPYVVPPVTSRRWKPEPAVGDISANACGDPAVSDARIMTPAFAHAFVWTSESTRAT